MNWFIHVLQKEARGRRYRPNDAVRYFSDSRKGKGKGIVLTPPMSYGRVKEWDQDTKRYKILHNDGTETDVHPRNIIPDPISKSEPISEPMIDPFPR